MMRKVEHILKEGAEVALRRGRRWAAGRRPPGHALVLDQLRTHGHAVIDAFWPPERCQRGVEAIDRAIKSDTACRHWSDAEGSDQRLYFAERIGGELENFYRDPTIERLRSFHSGVARAETLLLAARLSFVPGNRGSGGGWHRDSPHRSQFKALLYLSDVGPDNGPFEYIEGSHLAGNSLSLLFRGQCRPNQYRFADEEIERILAEHKIRRTFIAPAGTLFLIDTKGIHRGAPIVQGRRYALTQYCFDGGRPRHFLP